MSERERRREREGHADGAAALADWRPHTHFLFAAHNLPNEACHSPRPLPLTLPWPTVTGEIYLQNAFPHNVLMCSAIAEAQQLPLFGGYT